MTKQEFKELFLKLTEYTIPFGKESTLEGLLPSGWKKDSTGNYFYQIGDSQTLFTTHLDTYSDKYEKVNHIIDDYKISTDEKTILGGDNKLGCSILISMILDRIPGTYYFFLGEEPILSGGVFGSTKALESNPEFFKKFKRAIAFDRRGYGSIVVRQMGRMSCSSEFAKQIANEFDIKGIKWDSQSGFGYYTDTAVFMDIIPECTNISAGGFNEHYTTEWVDLNYTWNVYLAAKSMDWEALPVVRELENRFSKRDSKLFDFSKFREDSIVRKIHNIMELIDLKRTRLNQDDEKTHITYSKWLEDFDLDIIVKGEKIFIGDINMTIESFTKWIFMNFENEIISEIYYNMKDDKLIKTYKSIFGDSKINDIIIRLKEHIKNKNNI
jgi:hypothetical protein